jgi:hypothetical protein
VMPAPITITCRVASMLKNYHVPEYFPPSDCWSHPRSGSRE